MEGFQQESAKRLRHTLCSLRYLECLSTQRPGCFSSVLLKQEDHLDIKSPFLKSIPEAIERIDKVGSPDIGFCYDFYHVWDREDIFGNTERYANAKRVFGVQYNDWRQSPRSMADRVLPGDGVIDTPGILGALDRGGYTGWYDFKVFSDDGRWGTEIPESLWKMPNNYERKRLQFVSRLRFCARRKSRG